MRLFLSKLKYNMIAVSLIVGIVLILNFTLVPFGTALLTDFLAGSALTVLGLSFFLMGVDTGVMPLGSRIGGAIAKPNKLWVVVAAGIILGFFVSVAEPGLMVFAEQVDLVTSGRISYLTILIFVSSGLAVFLAVGFMRIHFDFPLSSLLILAYIGIGVMAVFTRPEFLAIAFDASGATTGIMAVPFIFAFGVGITKHARRGDGSPRGEDSFGLISLASIGAILGVFALNMLTRETRFDSNLQIDTEVSHSIAEVVPGILLECAVTLLPLFVILIFTQLLVFKMERREFHKLTIGFGYAFIGLALFFTGVHYGFLDVGRILGYKLAAMDSKMWIIIIGFMIGFIIIITEPAVFVQTRQIEAVTEGHIKRTAVLIPLCVGVGFAVMFSVVRMLTPAVQLWHFLLPGYIISLGLTFFVPKLFVGIAFDAGGVATGPMTATFTLSFIQGAAANIDGSNVLRDGFGMIALVAMFPIITLQILGLIYKLQKSRG